ncbi:MAG: glycosyltransferase family 2 protein, partial [Promethearchaeota archaeon]
ARNIGIRHSRYDYIGFLDDDCIPIRKDLLLRAYTWLKSRKNEIIGVGGPIYDNSLEYKSKKFKLIDLLNLKKIPEFIQSLIYKPNKLSYANTIPGGNCFFRKKIVLECGGFDPSYDGNYYREESDLCRKIKKYGRIISDPCMPVNHLQVKFGGCRRTFTELYYYIFSNTVLLYLKHKKISIEVFLDTLKHLFIFLYILVSGTNNNSTKIKRTQMIKSFVNGFSNGIYKYFKKSKDTDIEITEKLEF